MHPLWQAEWSVMDDHGMLSVIGPDGRLPWSAVPAAIRKSEAGHPGEFSRYRPLTFTPQILESAIIGPRPGLWYGWRTVQFAFVLAVVWWVASAFLGMGLATLLTIYTTTHYYWSDSFAHLFVSENWASIWLAVFAVGAERLWQWRQRPATGSPTVPLVVMAVSGAMAGATKENMLVLLPLYAVALWWASRCARLRLVVWGAALIYVFAGAFVAGAVLTGLRHAGGIDLYGNPVNFGERVSLVWRPLPAVLAASWVTLLLAWRLAMRVSQSRLTVERQDSWRALWSAVLAVAAILTLVLVSQFVFYNGQWPTRGARFDFPGRLVEVVLYAAVWHFGCRGADVWQLAVSRRRLAGLVFWVSLTALTLRHPVPLLRASEERAAATHRVGDVRRAVAAAVVNEPDRPIVMLASDVGDEEAAYSLARQLRVIEHVPNPIFLDVRAVPDDVTSVYSADNVRRIRRLAGDGGGGMAGRMVDPISAWSELAVHRHQGAVPPFCVALRGYEPAAITACPGGMP